MDSSIHLLDRLKIEGLNEINDYEYDAFGCRLAVSGSNGYVSIYQKDKDGKFVLESSFKGADSAIWKISWSHPKYGELIGVASFSKTVSVFQNRNGEWVEVASHNLHEGSVNQVQWAPFYYGLKLYACSSDGNFSVLEVRNQAWHSRLFEAHDVSINSLAVQTLGLLDETDNLEKEYPMVVTGGKDRSVTLWKYNNQTNMYAQHVSYTAHKDAIRNLLWKSSSGPNHFEIFSCSEDGTVKLLEFNGDMVTEEILLSDMHPIVRLSQSPTGSFIVASIQDADRSVVIRQTPTGQWVCNDELTP